MAVRDALKRSLPGRIVGPVDRFTQTAGLSAGAADPRAAYPPREGDFQHLHGAGAARHHRLDVRGLSRAGRIDPHRANRASPHRRAGGGIAQAWLRAAVGSIFRHRDGGRGRQARRDRRAARVPSRSTCGSVEGTLGIALDETTTPAVVEAVWRAFGGKLAYAEVEAVTARGAACGTQARDRFPHPSGISRPSLGDRTSALHAQAE